MLTATAIRNAKPGEKPYKLPDGGGLHLYISPAGGRTWRWRYRFPDASGRLQEKLLTIGRYPEVGAAEARDRRDQARKDLRAGIDPSAAKRLKRLLAAEDARDSFGAVAQAWHERQVPLWSEQHAAMVWTSLRPILQAIGDTSVGSITPPMVLALLRPLEARSPETARRVRQRMSAVFVYAIAAGKAETDPSAIVAGALAPVAKGRQPAIVDLEEARAVLGRIEATPAHPLTKLALRLLALTSVRPGEIRGAVWSEFDGLDGPEPTWRIPASRMKMRREHWVPLAPEAVEVLRTVRELGIRGDLLFPSVRNWRKPMSANALCYLTNRAGFHGKHVPHGWRSTFSTVMNERFPNDRAVIDLMLAHVPPNTTEAAYNRAMHLKRRRELAKIWAAMLLSGAGEPRDLLSAARRLPAIGQAAE